MGYNCAKKKMKKRILFVSMIVATSLVMMFVSCKKENETPKVLKGCSCDILDTDGARYTESLTVDQMTAYYSASDCNTLASLIKYEGEGDYASVSCSGLY